MKKILFIALILLSAGSAFAQSLTTYANYTVVGNGSAQAKNFYFLFLLQQDAGAKHLLENDPILSGIAKQKAENIRQAMAAAKDYHAIIAGLQFSDNEIQIIGKRLSGLLESENPLGMILFDQLDPSGMYIQNQNNDGQGRLVKAWEQDAAGINHTIAVYGEGKKPNYPDIDSISFKVNDPSYLLQVNTLAQDVLNQTSQSKLFFLPSMMAALDLLRLNGRNDAGNYEPMATGVNQAALDKALNLDWGSFAYSVILVPGEGPDTYEEAISPGGMERCKLAAKAYEEGLAPFIMVSGGKVHPYKTKYCEAEEMKKYLVEQLGIPDNAVIMEPHARHTTTNLRNAVRLMIHYHFPVAGTGLIVTDKGDNDYITGMADRCKAELGDVPYKLGKRISDTGLEFYMLPDALQINSLEPLDP